MSDLDKSFDDWFYSNYLTSLDDFNGFDIKDAFQAGQRSKQKEIDRLKAIIAEALAVYDRPMCDETALYQRDDDIYHILTEDKFV